MELMFGTERYSEDAVVPAASEETLVAMLSQQDSVAPKFRVCHVVSKEEGLYIKWNGRSGARWPYSTPSTARPGGKPNGRAFWC